MCDARIWILTINDNTNFGNRLQNYALQYYLSHYCSRVSTIHTEYHSRNVIKVVKRYLRPFKRFLIEHHDKFGLLLHDRRISFESFTDSFVNDSRLSLSPERGFSHPIKASDFFVIGSDQVWNDNPDWVSKGMLSLRLGSAFPSQKVISYAASFGVSHIRDAYQPMYGRLLSKINSISVREDRGAELVQELSGRQSTVVLDPTLMLTADQWRSIIPGDFVSEDEKYVLTYFLGKPSPEQERVIQQYAKAHGCKVRRMLDLDDPSTYVAGPREFVELFSKAQYVFTDSYHACCFSILFNKQFKVFNRAGFSGKTSMNSRMTTLFRLFELNDLMDDDTKLETVDYSRVNALLEQHRRESRAWLEQALTKIGAIA